MDYQTITGRKGIAVRTKRFGSVVIVSGLAVAGVLTTSLAQAGATEREQAASEVAGAFLKELGRR